MMRTTYLNVAILVFVFCVWSCDKILDIPSNPTYPGADMQGNTGTNDPDAGDDGWACLDSTETEPARSTQDAVTVEAKACNFLKPNCIELVPKLSAKLCSKIDVNCATPIADDISGETGEFEFEVPAGGSGFDGFLLIDAPAALCTDTSVFGPDAESLCALAPGCNPEQPDERCMFPTVPRSLFFFNPPIQDEPAEPFVVNLVPTAAVPQLVQAGGGGEVDPGKGFLFITAYGCDGQPAAGVSFTTNRMDEVSVPLYLDEGVVSTVAVQTDESGLGGIAGVPTGFIEVAGKTATRREVGAVGVQVAPFAITYVDLVPQ